MRLHDTQTGKFLDRKEDDPPYAILSHTWGANEQTFQDVRRIQGSFHVPTLLRMLYPALVWILATLFSTVFNSLANFFFINMLFMLTAFGVTIDQLQGLSDLDPMVADRRPERHYRKLFTIFRAWSRSLVAMSHSISPQLSVLNDSRLSEKIRKACAVACLDHFTQLWVDTSCIDKTSSTELSEAINSMFAWYRDAAVCYAYLADVPRSGDPRRPGSAFRYSRWFTRGWTLQELIAPRVVVFLSREWEVIGTKESLADVIEDITGIHRNVLMHRKSHNDVSVAARMSWAAERITTRVEDQAYCLLGIFGIVMTPIYGEGEHAFRRLQEEILSRIPDDSIFAWESHVYDTMFSVPRSASSSDHNASIPRNHLMRLLDTRTGEFVDHPENGTSPYAVFSHIWDVGGEMQYHDILQIQRIPPILQVIARRPWLSWYRIAVSLHPAVQIFLHVPQLCVIWLALKLRRIAHYFRRRWSWTRTWMWSMWFILILDDPRMSLKIRKVCTIARRDGHNLLWIDSSCVDNQNAIEMRRTLVSKYAWYRNATVCYVYLPDVPYSEDPHAQSSAFRESQWFKQCRTLEDLIAPRVIIFLSQEWEFIGTKESLADLIEDITGVHRDVLTYRRLPSEVSYAERVSWGARRSTERFEDRAYSLLGLLNITMTLHYGEGERAFRRLREKILQRNPNEILFPSGHSVDGSEAWQNLNMNPHPASECHPRNPPHTFFAPSPLAFLFSGDVHSISHSPDSRHHAIPDHPGPLLRREYITSPYGIRTRFYLLPFPNSAVAVKDVEAASGPQWYLIPLACERRSLQNSTPHLLARLCYTLPNSEESSSITLHVGEFIRESDGTASVLDATDWRWQSLIAVPKRHFDASIPEGTDMAVYIPHHQYSLRSSTNISWNSSEAVTKILVHRWMKAMLHARGYHIKTCTSKGSSTPLYTSDMISLRSSSSPHILDMTKDNERATIFLPAHAWPASLRNSLGLVGDHEAGISIQSLSCVIVTPSDPAFEILISREFPRGSLSDSLPEEVARRCASQYEWKVGDEIVRPSLIYISTNHYELRIDVVEE